MPPDFHPQPRFRLCYRPRGRWGGWPCPALAPAVASRRGFISSLVSRLRVLRRIWCRGLCQRLPPRALWAASRCEGT